MIEEEIKNNNIESTNIQTPKQRPLFTQQQIAQQVRDFIYAYRNGRIKIILKETGIKYEYTPLGNPSDAILQSYKNKVKDYNNKNTHTSVKSELRDLIRICEGTKTATDEERYAKMLELFDRILTLQADEMLEGKIQSYDFKERFAELEKKVSGVIARLD